MEIAIGILALTNFITIFLLFQKKQQDKRVDALRRAIAAFEVEGQTILSISKINPDNVYLRNPMGH